MQTVIGVRFKQAGKIYYFGAGQMEIAQGDDVIVETARGTEFGHVALGPREVPDEEVTLPLKAVERRTRTARAWRKTANGRKKRFASARRRSRRGSWK